MMVWLKSCPMTPLTLVIQGQRRPISACLEIASPPRIDRQQLGRLELDRRSGSVVATLDSGLGRIKTEHHHGHPLSLYVAKRPW